MRSTTHTATIAHHLRLFGLAAAERDGQSILVRGSDRRVVRVYVQPNEADVAHLSLEVDAGSGAEVTFPGQSSRPWARLPSVDSVFTYRGRSICDVVATQAGQPCWVWVRHADVDSLVVGTAFGSDLVRRRQGDASRAQHRPDHTYWGIPGERPNYLFEGQVARDGAYERVADWWAAALVQAITDRLDIAVPPLMPNGEAGMVVVTGDDDQAFLEKYDEQLQLLHGMPITYFLHPLTRHTKVSLQELGTRSPIELGLHPDALEFPENYGELYRTQSEWFSNLVGTPARLVRNHGYLNDGYWGHLPVWLGHNVRASANLPGVDGTVLNGSLLPARVEWAGQLTSHWSILTAVGDGVRFALGMDGPQSAACVHAVADRIEQSGVPGVLVINLHPQNVTETRDMHLAIRSLVEERGFSAMTLGECIDWFARRDEQLERAATS